MDLAFTFGRMLAHWPLIIGHVITLGAYIFIAPSGVAGLFFCALIGWFSGELAYFFKLHLRNKIEE